MGQDSNREPKARNGITCCFIERARAHHFRKPLALPLVTWLQLNPPCRTGRRQPRFSWLNPRFLFRARSCNRRSGRREERLTRHASRTQVVSTMENREDRLLTPLRLNCDFQLPFLDIEHFLASVALCNRWPAPCEIRR